MSESELPDGSYELKGRGVGRKQGHMTPSRSMWVRVHHGEYILFDGDEKAWIDQMKGRETDVDAVKVELRQIGGRGFKLNLTSLTGAELRALAEFWRRVFELALPRVDDLDRQAEEAFQEGDDTYARLYRQDPIIYIREFTEDGKRVATPLNMEKE